MSLSLGILLITVTFFGLRGYFKGFFGAVSRALGLVAGCAALAYGLKPLVAGIKSTLGLDGIIVYLVAGILLFAGASLLVNLILQTIERLLSQDSKPSPASKIGGLLVGASVGTLTGLVLIYSISLFQEMRDLRVDNDITSLGPDIQPKLEELPPLERSSRQFMASVISQVTGLVSPEAAPFAAALMESPSTMTRSVQTVTNDHNLRGLLNDKAFLALLSRGDVYAIQQDPRFQQVMKMPELRYLLQKTGMGIDQHSSDHQVATWAVETWQKVEHIQNDKEVQAILQDQQFQKKLDSGDKFSLMTDPQFKNLLERFLNAVPNTPHNSPSND